MLGRSQYTLNTDETTAGRMYLVFICLVAALGALVFGYDTAVISGAIPFITTFFQLNELMLGIVVSSTLVGCIPGAMLVGKPADKFGRKPVLFVVAILFLISAIGSGCANTTWSLAFFRFVGGIAVGAASVIAPMYIAEVSPAGLRGRMVAITQINIVFGMLVAYVANYYLLGIGNDSWRWMLMALGVPAAAFAGLVLFIPDSPRWLVLRQRKSEALRVLSAINGEAGAERELRAIQSSLASHVEAPYSELVSPRYRHLLVIGLLVATFNQLTGINVIMYYAPTILQKTGVATDSSLLQTALIGLNILIFTMLAMATVDKVGRKPLLVVGSVGMIVFQFMLAAAFHWEGYWVLICILGFIASFAFSQGTVIWIVLTEIYPNRIRAKAQSIATLTHWVWAFVITLAFPSLIEWIGGATFAIFGAAMVLQLIFVIGWLPETKGKSLEELESSLTLFVPAD
jgi:sugar porter (SP) family MFS transporter